MINETYPFSLPPLSFAYDALEPNIDAETMHYHHDKHFQTYVNNLNKALEPYPALQKLTLRQLLSGKYPLPQRAATAILNNGGGVFNHGLFFDRLSPESSGRHQPQGQLLAGINGTYGSFDKMKEAFNAQALAVFGSGWTFLVQTGMGALKIVSLKNQDTLAASGARIVVIVDVWEHAYYLKYRNDRAGYLNNIWNVIDLPVL